MLSNKQKCIHIFSLALSFLFALISIITLAVFAVSTTISQPTYMKNKIESSGYAIKAATELEELFKSYGAASGFDIAVFKTILDEKIILSDMKLTIDKIYFGTEAQSQEEIKRKIFSTLVNDVNNRNIVMTKEIQDGIDELAKTCAFDYVNKVSLPYFDYITKVIHAINLTINKFKLFLWSAMAVVAICILYVNKASHRCFRYFSYSSAAMFIVLAIIPVMLLISDKLNYFSISPPSLNNFFVEYISGIFFVVLCMAAGSLILSLLCAGCYFAFRNKKLKRAH